MVRLPVTDPQKRDTPVAWINEPQCLTVQVERPG